MGLCRIRVIVGAVLLAMFACVKVVYGEENTREYYGYDIAAGKTLTIVLDGSILSGQIQGEDWHLTYSGASNGSNMTNTRVTVKTKDATHEGFMILRWHPDGVHTSLIIKGNRELSGQYPFSKTPSKVSPKTPQKSPSKSP